MSSTSSSKVNLFFEGVKISISSRKELKKSIEHIFKTEQRRLESINYIFVRDRRILQINKEFLQHNFYTDIITFEYSKPKEPAVSDVYISIDRVKENAVSHGTFLKQEIRRVMFHGALHLCGYKDKTPFQKKQMREREEYYLLHFS